MSFKDLELHESILKAIEELGFTSATPIQKQAIPKVIEGYDLRASAQTGTGKTAAFILPALHKLMKPAPKGRGPRILVLVPTRELAMQVAGEAAKFSKYLPRVKTVCIYGGAPYPIQNRQLSAPYEILVATPGRLIDHLERGRIDLSRVEMFILDEADRMLDMGFIGPVEEIASATPKGRQTLLFSATMKGQVLKLSQKLLTDPVEVTIAPEKVENRNIEQRLHYVDNIGHKNRLLDHLLTELPITQAIVFTATKRHADHLVDTLCDAGHQAGALHGDMNQRQRTRTLTKLRQGEIQILVATDVAARGIDILTVSHVINFDLPQSVEDYVHRIGRTGRAGGKGVALSFAISRDAGLVRRIEQFTGEKMAVQVIPGLEPKNDSRAASSKFGQRRYGQGRDERRGPPRHERRTFSGTHTQERTPRTSEYKQGSTENRQRPSEYPRFRAEGDGRPRAPFHRKPKADGPGSKKPFFRTPAGVKPRHPKAQPAMRVRPSD